MNQSFRVSAFALGLFSMLVVACVSTARAEDAGAFYKTHRLTITVPNEAGGGYDTYVRALAEFLPRHVPGNPTVVVQNIPAAGGMVQANELYVTAPKDGSVIGMVRGTVLAEGIFKNPKAKFDGSKFNWLINMNSDVDTCIVSPASEIKTIADFYTKEAVAAATGVGAQSYSFPIAYDKILGMKFKVIPGYSGTPNRLLAMERGEVNSACGITVSTFQSQVAKFAQQGKVILIAQAGLKKDSRYPDLPNMLDQAKTPEQKQLMHLLLAPLALGRPIAAPPGVPADLVAALRKAMDDTLSDADFQARAKKVRIDVQSMTGAETKDAVDALSEASPAVAAKLKSIIGG